MSRTDYTTEEFYPCPGVNLSTDDDELRCYIRWMSLFVPRYYGMSMDDIHVIFIKKKIMLAQAKELFNPYVQVPMYRNSMGPTKRKKLAEAREKYAAAYRSWHGQN